MEIVVHSKNSVSTKVSKEIVPFQQEFPTLACDVKKWSNWTSGVGVGQKSPTPTPSVVRDPTPPKNLRHLTTPQPLWKPWNFSFLWKHTAVDIFVLHIDIAHRDLLCFAHCNRRQPLKCSPIFFGFCGIQFFSGETCLVQGYACATWFLFRQKKQQKNIHQVDITHTIWCGSCHMRWEHPSLSSLASQLRTTAPLFAS